MYKRITKKIGVLLVALAIMCVFLVSCGSYQVTTTPRPGYQFGPTTEPIMVAPDSPTGKRDRRKDSPDYCCTLMNTGPPTKVAAEHCEVSEQYTTCDEDLINGQEINQVPGRSRTTLSPGFGAPCLTVSRVPASA